MYILCYNFQINTNSRSVFSQWHPLISMLWLTKTNWWLKWGVTPPLARNSCHSLGMWLLTPPLMPLWSNLTRKNLKNFFATTLSLQPSWRPTPFAWQERLEFNLLLLEEFALLTMQFKAPSLTGSIKPQGPALSTQDNNQLLLHDKKGWSSISSCSSSPFYQCSPRAPLLAGSSLKTPHPRRSLGWFPSTARPLVTATWMVQSTIGIVRSLRLINSNPDNKSFTVGACSSVTTGSNVALSLSNREKMRILLSHYYKLQGQNVNCSNEHWGCQ